MTLTAAEVANTVADAFDVRLRYFAASKLFTTLTDLADFRVVDAAPNNWIVSGDNITPTASWSEVTSHIHHNGSFTATWSGGQITWQATIGGNSYQAEYWGAGQAICCLRRIVRGAYDSGWVLWWIGVCEAGRSADDYRKGGQWQRTVRGIEATLELADSPRLVVGNVNVLEGATATASSTLATPGDEAGNGEFVGVTAAVDASNAVDGRRGTVWIAQNAPSLTGESLASAAGLKVDEVFNHPVAGYNRSTAWWVEIVNTSGGAIEIGSKVDSNGNRVWTNWALYALNSDGQTAMVQFVPRNSDTELSIGEGERFIVCADRRIFNALTGGASGAKHVLETKALGPVAPDGDLKWTDTYRKFDLKPENGWVIVGTRYDESTLNRESDGVKWGTVTMADENGTSPGLNIWAQWSGAGVNIGSIANGQSIRRSPTGTDTHAAADWTIEPFPRPGSKYDEDAPEWLQLVTQAHTSTLGENISAGANTIIINQGTLGWPVSGNGVFDNADEFAYTGRTATALTGVTGVGAHTAGAALWPLDNNDEAMTGWYCARLEVYRRNEQAGAISRARVYLSPYTDCATPEDANWETDYAVALSYQRFVGPIPPRGGEDFGQPSFDLTNVAQPWVRTVLIVIDEMTDSEGDPARAKINEVTLRLADTVINDATITAALSANGIWYLVQYLLANYAWCGAGGLTVSSPSGWGVPGDLTLAIGPLPQILADIVRVHGAILSWDCNGGVTLSSSPWWPGGAPGDSWLYAFSESSMRGELLLSDTLPPLAGIALSANDVSGAPLPRVVVPPGTRGSGVREITGYTVSSVADLLPLAWSEYWQATSTQRASWNVKGVGEWCYPLQRYRLSWDAADRGQWLCERVTYTWAQNKWECKLDVRRYYA